MIVWIIDDFNDEEQNYISSYLNVPEDVEFTYENPGTSIYDCWASTNDSVMCMIDRDCYNSDSYIIAEDVSTSADWYVQAVLPQYNIEYTDEWNNEDVKNILRFAAIPYARLAAGELPVYDVVGRLSDNSASMADFIDVDSVGYVYAEDANVEERLNELDIGGNGEGEE